MKRNIFISLFLLLLSIILMACSAENKNITVQEPDEKKQRVIIGVTVLDLANPYYVQIVNGIKEEAEKSGTEIIINDPKSDAAKQLEAVEGFIDTRVDAIIIAALDPKATRCLKKPWKQE